VPVVEREHYVARLHKQSDVRIEREARFLHGFARDRCGDDLVTSTYCPAEEHYC